MFFSKMHQLQRNLIHKTNHANKEKKYRQEFFIFSFKFLSRYHLTLIERTIAVDNDVEAKKPLQNCMKFFYC